MGHSVSVQVRYARAGNLAGCGKIILHTRTSMVRTSGTSPVSLVSLVCLVCLVCLVYLVEPDQPDRRERPGLSQTCGLSKFSHAKIIFLLPVRFPACAYLTYTETECPIGAHAPSPATPQLR